MDAASDAETNPVDVFTEHSPAQLTGRTFTVGDKVYAYVRPPVTHPAGLRHAPPDEAMDMLGQFSRDLNQQCE